MALATLTLAGCLNQSAASATETSIRTPQPATIAADGLTQSDRSLDEPMASGSIKDTSNVGRPAQPIQLSGASVLRGSGVGGFTAFLDGFLNAVEHGLTEDYVGQIRFPLPMTRFESSYVDPITGERRRRDYQEHRSVSRAEFTRFLIHDPDARSQSVYNLEHGFSGPNTRAIYRGNRMLTFTPFDGSWVLSEIRVCIQCGQPEVLLCARPGRQTAFPGRGPDGNEDFYAFFEVFYCAAESYGDSDRYPHLTRARTNPDGAALSRIRFPLRGTYVEMGSDVVEEYEVTEYRFHLGSFFSRDSGASPPGISVDGDQAEVDVHGVASDHGGISKFTRIDGLWYLTGLSS